MIKKTFNKLRREGNIFNLIKSIYKNPIANITLGGERLNTFPSGQGCLLLPLLFNIVLAVLSKAIRQEDETKGIQIGKK